MRLQGLHHITMITGDATRNVEFYADVLGLRLVKQTVNFDAPEAYHLYFGDERGTPGSILTWFEFQGAARGRAGAGMIHTIALGVSSPDALPFWSARLRECGYDSELTGTGLRFADYDGLQFELLAVDGHDAPLRAVHPDVPAQHAIVGVAGARAYSPHADLEDGLLTATLGFEHAGAGEYRLDGERRSFRWSLDLPPQAAGSQGAGTVHHIAWASLDDQHLDWQRRVRDAGLGVTGVRDRDYFRSVYFREPRGVLFEIATLSPGFAIDEDPDHLGEQLRVPEMHAHLREHLQRTLTPLQNPRVAQRERVAG